MPLAEEERQVGRDGVAELLELAAILFEVVEVLGETAQLEVAQAAYQPAVHQVLLGVRQRDAGGTILISTHLLDTAEKLCDRVGIVCKGELIALDSPHHLKQQHTERKADIVLKNNDRVVIDLDPRYRESAEESLVETAHLLADRAWPTLYDGDVLAAFACCPFTPNDAPRP